MMKQLVQHMAAAMFCSYLYMHVAASHAADNAGQACLCAQYLTH